MILYALGVDEQTILEVTWHLTITGEKENERAVKGMVQLYKMDEAVAREILSAQENYIMATYNAVMSEYGSMDIFFEKALGMSNKKSKNQRTKFLE